MQTKVGVGVSHHRNPVIAAKEAYRHAMVQSEMEGRPDFIFLYATVGYDQSAVVRTVREISANAPLAGCSTEGVIAQSVADESNFSVALMAIQSDEVMFSHARAEGVKRDPQAVGALIAGALRDKAGKEIIGMIVLADGIHFNHDRFSEGFHANFPSQRQTLLFGGMASDNWAMQKTYQYFNDEVITDGVVCALMHGTLRAAYAVNHGCVAIGTERTVTKAEKNVIYEIDNKPVLDILKEYLLDDEIDNWQKTVVNLSWGLKVQDKFQSDYDDLTIRFMPARDETNGSITISSEIAEGTKIWMTRRDHKKIADGVEKIAALVMKQLGGNRPKMVFQFECCGRGKVVFREQQKREILGDLQETLGADIPWLGFYVYGEIGPVGTCNAFHNYTMVLLALY